MVFGQSLKNMIFCKIIIIFSINNKNEEKCKMYLICSSTYCTRLLSDIKTAAVDY